MDIYEREQSLREYFLFKKDKLKHSINSMAIELGIPERTIREFVLGYKDKNKETKKRTLSPSNYNKIVDHLKMLPLHLRKLKFEDLVNLLKDTKIIKWDIHPTFESRAIKKLEFFRDFVEKNMKINDDSYLKGKSLLKLINPEGKIDDPFEHTKRYLTVHNKYKKNFMSNEDDLDLGIFGANYYKFLMEGDDKEVFIFLTFNKLHKQKYILMISHHSGLFEPKLWRKKDGIPVKY